MRVDEHTFAIAVAAAGSLELPQTTVAGGNYAISGEYGSSSEGTLQLSGNGQYLTIMGYGINANTYKSTYDVNGTGTALAQSPNTTVGGANVARVIALIGADGALCSGRHPQTIGASEATSRFRASKTKANTAVAMSRMPMRDQGMT